MIIKLNNAGYAVGKTEKEFAALNSKYLKRQQHLP